MSSIPPSVLSPEEVSFLTALKITHPNVSSSVVSLFFSVVLHSPRPKRIEMLEKFFIYPLIRPGGADHLCRVLLDIPNWQEIVFALFEDPDIDVDDLSVPLDAVGEQKLFSLSMLILSVTLWSYARDAPILILKTPVDIDGKLIKIFEKDDSGFLHLLLHTFDLLEDFAGWNGDVIMLGRLLILSMVNQFGGHAKKMLAAITEPKDKDKEKEKEIDVVMIVWGRLFQFFDFLDIFLFYRPPRPLMYWNSNVNGPNGNNNADVYFAFHIDDSTGLCEDLILVEKVLDAIEKTFFLSELEKAEVSSSSKFTPLPKSSSAIVKRLRFHHTSFALTLQLFKSFESLKIDPSAEAKIIDDFCEFSCEKRGWVHGVHQMDNKKKMKSRVEEMKKAIVDGRKKEKFEGAGKLAQNIIQKKGGGQEKEKEKKEKEKGKEKEKNKDKDKDGKDKEKKKETDKEERDKESKSPPTNVIVDVTPKAANPQILRNATLARGTLAARQQGYDVAVSYIRSRRSFKATLAQPLQLGGVVEEKRERETGGYGNINATLRSVRFARAVATPAPTNALAAPTASHARAASKDFASAALARLSGNNPTAQPQTSAAPQPCIPDLLTCITCKSTGATVPNMREVMFDPCGHLLVCQGHAGFIENCNVCGKKIEGKKTVKFQ